MLITFSEMAILKGCSPAAVTYAVKHGRISDAVVEKEGKRWLDRDLALELWNKNTKATHNSKVSRPDPIEKKPKTASFKTKPKDSELRDLIESLPEDQIPDLNESRARREHYQAEKAKLEALQGRGELVSAADVKAAAFKKGRAVRDSIMAIPDRLAAQLAGTTDTRLCHQLLTEELRVALRVLADG